MNFEFDEVGAKAVAGQIGGEHGLLGIAHSRSVGEKLHMVTVDVGEHVVLLVLHVDTLHGYSNHLRTGCYD